jgi:threonyl-tRNA synthetase
VQAIGIPVAEEYAPYLDDVVTQMRAVGIRASMDVSDDRMQKKIRNATAEKIPVQVIVGEEDRARGAVSFRFRDGTQRNGIPVAQAIDLIRAAIDAHSQVNGADDL